MLSLTLNLLHYRLVEMKKYIEILHQIQPLLKILKNTVKGNEYQPLFVIFITTFTLFFEL
jgi:hypothetical protein